MGRLSTLTVYGNTAGITNFLGNGTAWAKTTRFEEKIETHERR
ncbi:MAG TPA: hypothetical protein VJU84_22160 [Pyrinomonadaceae bacterium]|nr:hypothetical protein [Pyrinomonadaceae bacterium]